MTVVCSWSCSFSMAFEGNFEALCKVAMIWFVDPSSTLGHYDEQWLE